MKKKLCFISSVSVPFMNKLSIALESYFDTRFVFYDEAVARPKWWRSFPLAHNAVVLTGSKQFGNAKYYNSKVIDRLREFDPDIVILGGFFIPSNWIAYRWAKKNGKKVIVFSEKLGYSSDVKSRKRWQYSDTVARIFRYLYKDVDLVFAVCKVGVDCFTQKFSFSPDRVVRTQYPVDMGLHLEHSLRKASDELVFLFPHRLIDLYDPLAAIEWFNAILEKFPNTSLRLNGFGLLRQQVINKIEQLGIGDSVSFADNIDSWEKLHRVYEGADVILSTKAAIEGDGDWSIAEMEACASGMGFIVTSSSFGLVEQLKSNRSGFVINDSCDLSSVVNAASDYVCLDGILEKHGKINRDKVRQYSIDNTAKTMSDVLFSKL